MNSAKIKLRGLTESIFDHNRDLLSIVYEYICRTWNNDEVVLFLHDGYWLDAIVHESCFVAASMKLQVRVECMGLWNRLNDWVSEDDVRFSFHDKWRFVESEQIGIRCDEKNGRFIFICQTYVNNSHDRPSHYFPLHTYTKCKTYTLTSTHKTHPYKHTQHIQKNKTHTHTQHTYTHQHIHINKKTRTETYIQTNTHTYKQTHTHT